MARATTEVATNEGIGSPAYAGTMKNIYARGDRASRERHGSQGITQRQRRGRLWINQQSDLRVFEDVAYDYFNIGGAVYGTSTFSATAGLKFSTAAFIDVRISKLTDEVVLGMTSCTVQQNDTSRRIEHVYLGLLAFSSFKSTPTT